MSHVMKTKQPLLCGGLLVCDELRGPLQEATCFSSQPYQITARLLLGHMGLHLFHALHPPGLLLYLLST